MLRVPNSFSEVDTLLKPTLPIKIDLDVSKNGNRVIIRRYEKEKYRYNMSSYQYRVIDILKVNI